MVTLVRCVILQREIFLMARLSAVLADYLQKAKPRDLVDVVIEVSDAGVPSPHGDRSERIAAAETQFAAATRHVADFVRQAGGEVLGGTWLGQAIKVRMPAEDVERLLSLDRVDLVDLPRRLTRG